MRPHMEKHNLFDLETTEEDLYQQAIKESLDVKIQKAIEFLKFNESIALNLSESGYYLCNSGGKDSGVIHHLAVSAGVKFTNNHNVTGIDPPELMRHIKKHYPDIIYHRQSKHIWTRVVEKANPPTRIGRWCCQEYKEKGGDGLCKIIGVRAEESARRKGLWRQFISNKRHGIVLCPILYWTDDDIWAYHKEFKLPYCHLYDEGYARLGCIGCPMSNRGNEFLRYPKYEAGWKRALYRLWDRWVDIPNRYGQPRFFVKYGSKEAFWEWWISGEAYKENEMCQMEFMFNKQQEDEE